MNGRATRRGRDVTGILLLDKPVGISSNAALQRAKRIYQARKAGHTGNLDMLASGLLPVCFGEATKISGFLLDAHKRYRTQCRLGITTTTADAEGEVVERRPVQGIDASRVQAVLAQFRGRIEQVPPMHSAIKHRGQPLYKLAHRGLSIERQPRPVTIFELELLCLDGDLLELEIACSKGTYVRTLAEDIGEALGCGAHVTALRRLAAGPFDVSGAVGLERLEELAAQGLEVLDGILLSVDAALANKPDVALTEDASYYLRRGQAVMVPHAPTQGWVRLYDARRRFLGVGEVLDDGRIAPRRLLRV